MPLTEAHRRDLDACLQSLRRQKPIDNVQIERTLMAILKVLLDDDSGSAPTAPVGGR
jgi:hypothetical protein